MTEFLSHFHETLVAIDELEGGCFDRTGIPPKTILHIFQLGVILEFRSLSVSTARYRYRSLPGRSSHCRAILKHQVTHISIYEKGGSAGCTRSS